MYAMRNNILTFLHMYMHQNVTDIHTGHVIQLYVYDNNKLDHKIIK
jgi:hypothetical protein